MITFSIKYYCKAFFQGRPLRGRREVRQVGAGDGREDEAHELPGDCSVRGRRGDCEVSCCIRIITLIALLCSSFSNLHSSMRVNCETYLVGSEKPDRIIFVSVQMRQIEF